MGQYGLEHKMAKKARKGPRQQKGKNLVKRELTEDEKARLANEPNLHPALCSNAHSCPIPLPKGGKRSGMIDDVRVYNRAARP
jgi:hypothetical protein